MKLLHSLPSLLALCLLGCVNLQPAVGKARIAPVSSVKATVYLIDDMRALISLGGEIVVVNGKSLGALSAGRYTWFQILPGIMDLNLNDPAIKSNKMTARRFYPEAGKTYYVRYKVVGRESDGALLSEIIRGVSRNAINYKPEHLQLLPDSEAHAMLTKLTLVGCDAP